MHITYPDNLNRDAYVCNCTPTEARLGCMALSMHLSCICFTLYRRNIFFFLVFEQKKIIILNLNYIASIGYSEKSLHLNQLSKYCSCIIITHKLTQEIFCTCTAFLPFHSHIRFCKLWLDYIIYNDKQSKDRKEWRITFVNKHMLSVYWIFFLPLSVIVVHK